LQKNKKILGAAVGTGGTVGGGLEKEPTNTGLVPVGRENKVKVSWPTAGNGVAQLKSKVGFRVIFLQKLPKRCWRKNKRGG